jgi:uncharacterized membrane protein (DUF4010 family)
LFNELAQFLPAEGLKILLVLFLSFLIGIEREEHKAHKARYAFGGVRTFPIIGLLGYGLALLSGDQLLPLAAGFAVVGSFLLISYRHKLSGSETAGLTSEFMGLTVYVIGALIYREYFWIASTLVVIGMFLLELKVALESLAERIPSEEIFTFTKFLLLTAIVLPAVPNAEFTILKLNPFKTWLVVAAVSTVSYASYVLQKATKQKGGILLAAILGGAYSSTVTTVVLAKRAAAENRPHLFSGCILVASGVMYLRLAILVGLFNRVLALRLLPAFLSLAAFALLGGWLWSRLPDTASGEVNRQYQARNPLEIRAALLFAVIFLAVMITTQLAIAYLGRAGVYTLAALMGVTDVDPFILSITASAGTAGPLALAAASILIAAASNNMVKGIYAFCFADRPTARQGLVALVLLGVMGLVPLFFLA